MRVEEMNRDENSTPTTVANDVFTKARKNVSDLLRGASFTGSAEMENDTVTRRSRAVQIRDHFNNGELAFVYRNVVTE